MVEESDVTARYLLPDLPEIVGEDAVRDYFSALGEIEEVTVKEHGTGKRQGSVKFSAPTMELRKIMLEEAHVIEGNQVSVMTWKMQKLQKPGYHAKKAAEAASKGRGRPGSVGPTSAPAIAAAAGKGAAWDPWSWDGGKGNGGYGPMWGLDPSWGQKGGPYGGKGCHSGEDIAWQKGMMYGKAAAMGKDPWSGACWGKGPGACWGGGGCGAAGGKGRWGEEEMTARFLLSELPDDVSEDTLRDYFGAFGNIEEVTLRQLGQDGTGKFVGSVKFLEPTMELRNMMLKEAHVINGEKITVQTHKMRKLAKPGYAASAAAAAAARSGFATTARAAPSPAAQQLKPSARQLYGRPLV